MSDNETTRYAILLIAAIIGLSSACISFVNSRLNEAKSAAKKKQILVHTAIAVDTLIFLTGCALVATSVFSGFGFMVLIFSFFTATALFVCCAFEHLRIAVADLVVRGFIVILIIMSSILFKMSENQRLTVDIQRNTTDILKGFSEALSPPDEE